MKTGKTGLKNPKPCLSDIDGISSFAKHYKAGSINLNIEIVISVNIVINSYY